MPSYETAYFLCGDGITDMTVLVCRKWSIFCRRGQTTSYL